MDLSRGRRSQPTGCRNDCADLDVCHCADEDPHPESGRQRNADPGTIGDAVKSYAYADCYSHAGAHSSTFRNLSVNSRSIGDRDYTPLYCNTSLDG